jgi:hypothetical protein
MADYTNMRTNSEMEKEIERIAELLKTSKSNIPFMFMSMGLTYFNDKQLTMEAKVHLPVDGRRKK